MDCCDRTLYDDTFDARTAERDLREYRRHGARGWTARLIDELAAGGVEGLTVLEIGAGVGAVHQSLLAAGASAATDVDASGPYLAVAKAEAERRGLADRVTYLKGDAVALASELPPADLVALDRVVCCYADMPALVGLAAARTRRRLAMVLPSDRWLVRAAITLLNGWSALTRDPFRAHAHRVDAVVEVARAAGLAVTGAKRGLVWQTLVLERPAEPANR